jgi:hypothetical protein
MEANMTTDLRTLIQERLDAIDAERKAQADRKAQAIIDKAERERIAFLNGFTPAQAEDTILKIANMSKARTANIEHEYSDDGYSEYVLEATPYGERLIKWFWDAHSAEFMSAQTRLDRVKIADEYAWRCRTFSEEHLEEIKEWNGPEWDW